MRLVHVHVSPDFALRYQEINIYWNQWAYADNHADVVDRLLLIHDFGLNHHKAKHTNWGLFFSVFNIITIM